MKVKIAVGTVVALLILAQLIFGGKEIEPGTPEHARKVLGAGMVESIETTEILKPTESGQSSLQTQNPVSPPPPRPAANDVVGIQVGTGEGALHLERDGDGWDIVGATSAPADSGKIRMLLSDLLEAEFQKLSESDKAITGLNGDGGLPVKLAVADGGDYEICIGVRPEGRYDAAYVRMPGGEVGILSADVRGELGLWRNTSDVVPDPSAWAEKRIMRFEPDEVIRIEAEYPDHRIAFERPQGGEWEQRGYIPGGEWDRRALEDWIRSLSKFQASGAGGTGDLDKNTQVRHTIGITLADGVEKKIRVAVNHTGDGMLAESSEYPGRLFTLPEWRFRRYFRRLHTLFPNAVPSFDLADIRFIDIRQGGETVKVANRNNVWQLSVWPYPLRCAMVERLARMLSTWRPEDYATPDFKSIRPLFAGPMIEVSLADGQVHQYRLAGRHPLYPWRYVIVDNTTIFSITDSEAALMFPTLADVLDLGKTLREQTAENIQEIRLEDGERKLLAALRREADGSWKGETDAGILDIGETEISGIIKKMLEWAPTGFYYMDSRPVKPVPLYFLHVSNTDGAEQTMQFFDSSEHDVPYITESPRAFLLERKAFFNWLGAVRALNDRVPSDEVVPEQQTEDSMHLEYPETGRNAGTEIEEGQSEEKAQEPESADVEFASHDLSDDLSGEMPDKLPDDPSAEIHGEIPESDAPEESAVEQHLIHEAVDVHDQEYLIIPESATFQEEQTEGTGQPSLPLEHFDESLSASEELSSTEEPTLYVPLTDPQPISESDLIHPLIVVE